MEVEPSFKGGYIRIRSAEHESFNLHILPYGWLHLGSAPYNDRTTMSFLERATFPTNFTICTRDAIRFCQPVLPNCARASGSECAQTTSVATIDSKSWIKIFIHFESLVKLRYVSREVRYKMITGDA